MPNDEDWAAGLVREFLAGEGDTFDQRASLRRALAEIGHDLPVSLGELEALLEDVQAAKLYLSALEQWQAEAVPGMPGIPSEARALWGAPGRSMLESPLGAYLAGTLGWAPDQQDIDNARTKVNLLEAAFANYAASYFGTQGEQVYTRVLRPPVPRIDELPTAEEFSSEWRNAFAAFSSGATGTQLAWLQRNEGELYQKYLTALMNYTKYGVSPFVLKEVQRLEQPAAGEGAAAALGAARAALGEGVRAPTEVSGTAAEIAERESRLGPGVPREFVALPRIDPTEWLQQNYPPERIQLLEAIPEPGQVRAAQQEMGGMIGQPRRLRG